MPDRANPEIIPLVTVWPTPNGLPIAKTNSPTATASSSLSARKGILSAFSKIKIAKSFFSSAKATEAANWRRSLRTTLISEAFPTT